ncbi:hypothetical protein [Bacillus marinisedimentorum]|uniref:hypothetical protein n=1 Tax=Bacillus marinisedimentorum TaxID=1821260 RepID=UPI000871EE02|nr:hypothetical protein [Bacillus marinisedimentorum]
MIDPHLKIEQAAITDIRFHQGRMFVEAVFQKTDEPPLSRSWKITLLADSTKPWQAVELLVFNPETMEYNAIGGLYSKKLADTLAAHVEQALKNETDDAIGGLLA